MDNDDRDDSDNKLFLTAVEKEGDPSNYSRNLQRETQKGPTTWFEFCCSDMFTEKGEKCFELWPDQKCLCGGILLLLQKKMVGVELEWTKFQTKCPTAKDCQRERFHRLCQAFADTKGRDVIPAELSQHGARIHCHIRNRQMWLPLRMQSGYIPGCKTENDTARFCRTFPQSCLQKKDPVAFWGFPTFSFCKLNSLEIFALGIIWKKSWFRCRFAPGPLALCNFHFVWVKVRYHPPSETPSCADTMDNCTPLSVSYISADVTCLYNPHFKTPCALERVRLNQHALHVLPLRVAFFHCTTLLNASAPVITHAYQILHCVSNQSCFKNFSKNLQLFLERQMLFVKGMNRFKWMKASFILESEKEEKVWGFFAS